MISRAVALSFKMPFLALTLILVLLSVIYFNLMVIFRSFVLA